MSDEKPSVLDEIEAVETSAFWLVHFTKASGSEIMKVIGRSGTEDRIWMTITVVGQEAVDAYLPAIEAIEQARQKE